MSSRTLTYNLTENVTYNLELNKMVLNVYKTIGFTNIPVSFCAKSLVCLTKWCEMYEIHWFYKYPAKVGQFCEKSLGRGEGEGCLGGLERRVGGGDERKEGRIDFL